MTKICGHKREALQWSLRVQCLVDRGLSAMLPGAWTDQATALNDILDPAKLAEMLASKGRRLGLSIAIYDSHKTFRMSGAPIVYALLIVKDGLSIMDRDKRGWDFDMSQARALLLKWLDLPDGAREEAELVLRGNHADPDKLAISRA